MTGWWAYISATLGSRLEQGQGITFTTIVKAVGWICSKGEEALKEYHSTRPATVNVSNTIIEYRIKQALKKC